MPRLPPIQSQKCGDNYEPMELDVVDSDEVDEILVLDDVNLDLESYISHYHGLPRIYRLEFVADHCNSLRVEALQIAINYIKDYTYNVKDYTRLFKKLQDAKQDPNLVIDNDWIDRKTKQANFRLKKLDDDLKMHRSNSMKENIRRGQDDMGDHYLDCGDLENAFNAYSKSRDYSTTQRNTVNQCLNMIGVSILLKRWSSVSNHILRAESQPPSDSPNANPAVATKLACASGLFDLNARHYKRAANHFLSTNFEHFTQPVSSINATAANNASGNHNWPGGAAGPSGCINPAAGRGFLGSIVGSQPVRFPDSSGHMAILAPVNIAVYGSLCALATYTRDELSTNLINSASFKQFSELDPQLREAVAKFYGAKYAACLSILQELKNGLLLDMYLAPHVERLYQAIRSKALVQYFQPYSTAKMTKMARAFNTSVEELEREIIPLIQDGHLNARIDSVNKILYAKRTDPRIQTFERAIKFGKLWQRQAEALITRTVIQKAELTVTNEQLPDKSC